MSSSFDDSGVFDSAADAFHDDDGIEAQEAEGGRDAVVFLIDASATMFTPSGGAGGGMCPMEVALHTVSHWLQQKVVQSEHDLTSVVFFASAHTQNDNYFEHVYVLRPLAEPGAEYILTVEALLDRDEFQRRIGSLAVYEGGAADAPSVSTGTLGVGASAPATGGARSASVTPAPPSRASARASLPPNATGTASATMGVDDASTSMTASMAASTAGTVGSRTPGARAATAPAPAAGRREPFTFALALWACSSLFKKVPGRLASKRIMLFTNNDDPLGGLGLDVSAQKSQRERARRRVEDLEQAGVELIPATFRTASGRAFDVNLFYRDVFGASLFPGPSAVSATPAGTPLSMSFDSAGVDVLENIKSEVARRFVRKRVLSRLALQLGPSVTLHVGMYATVRPARPPGYTYVDSASNAPLRTETTMICPQTAQQLNKTQVRKVFEYGGAEAAFDGDEMNELRVLFPTGLQLLGFKPLDKLSDKFFYRPGLFLYPDELVTKGSTVAFQALHATMLRRRVFAQCVFVRARAAAPRLCALVARDGSIDDQGGAPGMNLLYLPYADDVRHLHFPEQAPASSENLAAARALISSMRLSDSFATSSVCNPSLQKFHANLHAIALNRAEAESVVDSVHETIAHISSTKANVVEAFRTSFGLGTEYSVKRSAANSEAAAEKRAKVAAARDAARQAVDMDEWRKCSGANLLGAKKVTEMKEFLLAVSLPVSGSKQVLIERIQAFFASPAGAE